MGWRLRRSIKLGKGVRLNVSKKGLGISVGGKGFRVGVGPKGAYTSVGIPGTGLYSIDYLKSHHKNRTSDDKKTSMVKTDYGEISRTKETPISQEIPMPPELNVFSGAIGCLGLVISVVTSFIFTPLGVPMLIGSIFLLYKASNSPVEKARSYFIKGNKAYKKGDIEQAVENFKKVLEEKPDVYSLYPPVAALQRQMGDSRGSIESYEKYLAVYPDDAMVKLDYALTLGQLNDFGKMIEIIQSLPTEVKEDINVINAMGCAYLELGKPDLAIEILEKGPVRSRKVMDESMKLFRYLLGMAYKNAGKSDKAIKQFKKILAEDMDYADVKNILAELSS